jgi:hypothetical protein
MAAIFCFRRRKGRSVREAPSWARSTAENRGVCWRTMRRRPTTRRERQEVCGSLNRHAINAHESQVNLVDQRGGRERVADMLPAQLPTRDPSKLVVQKRHETVQRFGISSTPVDDKRSDVGLIDHRLAAKPGVDTTISDRV